MTTFTNSIASTKLECGSKFIPVRQALFESGVLNTMPKKSFMEKLRAFFGIQEPPPRIDFSRFMTNEPSPERFDNSDIPLPAATAPQEKSKWTGSSRSPVRAMQAAAIAPTPAEVRRHIDPDAGIGSNIAAGLGLAQLRQAVVGDPQKKFERPVAKRKSFRDMQKSTGPNRGSNESWMWNDASDIGSTAVTAAGVSALSASFAMSNTSDIDMGTNQIALLQVNPSTGLPMVNGAFDASGTPFGGIDFNSATDIGGI